MVKGFTATLSVALFMLVCLAVNVSAGYDRGSPYGDYEKEHCLRVCYRNPPRCAYGWVTRYVGSCYTCCRIKQKYIPYEDEQMNMENENDMNMNDEQPAADANTN